MIARPHKSESPARAELTQYQATTDENIVHDLDAERKTYLTLQARLALKGYSMIELSTGAFLISRWDRSAHCSDLTAVRAFLARIGGYV